MKSTDLGVGSFIISLALTLSLGLFVNLVKVRATSSTYTVCPAGPPTCNYRTIQAAVDAASEGDVIKIATGTYTDTLNPMVSITKSLTLRGGYAADFTDPPDFEAYPTVLDAQGVGSVIDVLGEITVTLEGLQITGGGDGGGLRIMNAMATLDHNKIFNNTRGLSLNNSQVTLSYNIIVSNTATSGGGVCVSEGSAIFSNNIIAYNTALAIWPSSSTYLRDKEERQPPLSILTTLGGGGLCLFYANIILTGNRIYSNTSYDKGGGLMIVGGATTLTNNFIHDNQAPIGDEAFLIGGEASLAHNTFASHTRGTGLFVQGDKTFGDPGIVTMTNSIFGNYGVGIYVDTIATVTVDSTLWGSGAWANTTDITNPTNWQGEAGYIYTGTLNLWDDPHFVSPETGNYHLRPDSLAIDAGINAGIYTDFDGEPRPYSAGFDIGADEYWANPPQKIYLPMVLR